MLTKRNIKLNNFLTEQFCLFTREVKQGYIDSNINYFIYSLTFIRI